MDSFPMEVNTWLFSVATTSGAIFAVSTPCSIPSAWMTILVTIMVTTSMVSAVTNRPAGRCSMARNSSLRASTLS